MPIEEQHGEHLVVSRAQLQLQEMLHGVGVAHGVALPHFLQLHPARQLQHGHQLRSPRRAAQAFAGLQGCRGRLQQTGQAIELIEQGLRQLQHVLPGQAAAQHDGQQLGVGQRLAAHGKQFFARAGLFGDVEQVHGDQRRG